MQKREARLLSVIPHEISQKNERYCGEKEHTAEMRCRPSEGLHEQANKSWSGTLGSLAGPYFRAGP